MKIYWSTAKQTPDRSTLTSQLQVCGWASGRPARKQHLAQHEGGAMLLYTDFGSDSCAKPIDSTMDMMKFFKT